MLATALAIAFLLTLAGFNKSGKTGGLVITGLCAMAIAFFLMPPFFSFRVSHPGHIVALTFYGMLGLVLAGKDKARASGLTLCPSPAAEKPFETDLKTALDEFMTTPTGLQLGAVNLSLPNGPVPLPCTHRDAVRILGDVIATALALPDFRRVSILAAEQPGCRRVSIAAQQSELSPATQSMVIGQKAEACEPLMFPGWPSNATATWFDDGCDRVYQIEFTHL